MNPFVLVASTLPGAVLAAAGIAAVWDRVSPVFDTLSNIPL